jgi:hypothetical protein
MKKAVLIAFCIVVLCSGAIAGIATAGLTAYSITEYGCIAPATIDGKWTTTDEWSDAPKTQMTANPYNAYFAYDIDFSTYGIEWVVELCLDNTNNPGDIVQLCLDNLNDGGTAPKTDDYKIELTGHSTIKLYRGTGTAWSEVSASELTWNASITTSPWWSTPHWVVEVKDADKTAGQLVTDAPPNGMFVAGYDAATSTWYTWAPGGTADVPNNWGLIGGYSMDPIPEGLSIVFIAVLSTMAVAGALALRRSKSGNLTILK